MTDTLTRCNFYCDDTTLAHLRRLAADRQLSFSQGIRVCLTEYFALRAESAAAMTAPGTLGDEQTGSLHQVVRRSESRMAESLAAQERHLARLHRELQVVQAMLDRAVLMYLLHTGEVPSAQRASADTSGKRRHDQWQKAVTRLLQNGTLPTFMREEDDNAHTT